MNEKEFQNFRRQLGKRIQDLRKEQGITQEELAAKINLDRVSIGYIEQGIRTPKLKTLLLISRAVHSTLAALFDDSLLAEK